MSDLQSLNAPRRAYFTADVLMGTHFPEPRWAVHGLVCEGLTILAGAQKMGKSWLMLGMAADVAAGGAVLGKIDTAPGEVLYLALEDPPRRVRWRLEQMLGATPPPPRLHIATEIPEPDNVIGLLENWLDEYPEARMVVVDVFAKVRQHSAADTRNDYARDYADVGALKRLADEHRVALVLVTHTRKMGADDAFDTISGSVGLTGAADTSMVLKRMRNETTAVLHVTGRDVSESEYALTFDPNAGRWTLDGTELAEAARKATEARLTATLDDRSRRIVEIVGASNVPLRADDVAQQLGSDDTKGVGTYLARLADTGRIQRVSRGLYSGVESVESVESATGLFHTSNTFHTCSKCGEQLAFDDGTGIHITCQEEQS